MNISFHSLFGKKKKKKNRVWDNTQCSMLFWMISIFGDENYFYFSSSSLHSSPVKSPSLTLLRSEDEFLMSFRWIMDFSTIFISLIQTTTVTVNVLFLFFLILIFPFFGSLNKCEIIKYSRIYIFLKRIALSISHRWYGRFDEK